MPSQLEFYVPSASRGSETFFFVIAGILSAAVMEFFENDLKSLLIAGLATTLILIIGAAVLYRNNKISRPAYVTAFGAPAVFIAFTFVNPFIASVWFRQIAIIGAGLLIVTIPYSGKLFIAESVSLALIALTLFRFLAILGISWMIVLSIFIAASGMVSALVFLRLEPNREHLRFGWPVMLVATSELFIIFMILPVNMATRTILIGATFYFYFKSIIAKHTNPDPMRLMRTDAIILGMFYLAILVSAHWI